jgi:hypothetical protein
MMSRRDIGVSRGRALGEKQAAKTSATLPFVRFFEAEIYPTMPPDAAEIAHRALL